MPPKRDKTTGLPLPSPVVPVSTVCATLQIPNAPEYKQAFRGFLSDLGKFWTWQRTQGESDQPARDAAELWRQALQTLVYDDDCEGSMSCADVADCIETNPLVRDRIQTMVNSTSTPQTIVTPGQPMTTAQANTPLNPAPPDCDPDVLWAQCEQLIEYMVNATTDTLEYIETYSNAIEGAQFIEMAPFLGTAVDEAQIDQVLEFIDWIIGNVKEYFDAANTAPARQEIACALFCACKADCEITVQRMWNVLNERLGGILNPSDIDSLDELLEALLTLVGNSSIALDAGLVTITGFAKFAGYLGIQGIDKTLNLVLKLAMNDANDDWILLCEECTEPVEERTPVISLPWDTPGGTLEGPDEDGFYIATTTAPASDCRIVIADISGRPFKLANLTYPGGVSSCQGWQREDTTVYVACTFTDQYNIQGLPTVLSVLFTWASPNTIRFQMVAP